MDLNRDKILESNGLLREEVDIPEWGGTVFVSEMMGQDRDSFELKLNEQQKTGNVGNISALVAVLTVVDRNGNRIFSDKDVVPLGRKSSRALQRIWKVAARLNGLGNQAQENLRKNS